MQDERSPPEQEVGHASQLPEIGLSDIDNAPVATEPVKSVSLDDYEKLQARFNVVSDEAFQAKEKLAREQSKVRTAETLDSLIKPYASKAYAFMVGYSVIAAAMLLLDGWGWKNFNLPDGVLELLVGSTAVTVIGLVGMVLTGIFVGARKAG